MTVASFAVESQPKEPATPVTVSAIAGPSATNAAAATTTTSARIRPYSAMP